MSLVLNGTTGLSDVDGSASTPAIRGTDTNTGMFFPAADTIAFAEGGTEVMRINSSGNVLVGTSTNPSSANVRQVLATSGDTYLQIASGSTGGGLFGQAGANMLFYTYTGAVGSESYSERMRIDSSGNLLVGGTTVCNSAANRGNITLNGTNNSILNFTNNNNSSEGGFVYFDGTSMQIQSSRASSTVIVRAVTNGVVLNNGATSWSSASDERVKDIIEPITDGLNKVASLRSVIGKYKTDEEGTRRSFLIAQDVQAVLPEAVVAQDDEIGTLTLSYTDTIPLLVKAIQELKAELDTVKTELATLKGASNGAA